MTRDEIVEIAWDVGLFMHSHKFQDHPTKLEKFAERIAAAERERIMQLFSRIDWHDPQELGEFYREVSGRTSPYSVKGDTVGQ